MSRKVYGILALFLTVCIVLTLFHPGGLMAYVLPSICWAALALAALYMMGGLERIRSWTNKRIALMALLVAVFQIFILIDAGLINKFGKSPLSFTPTGITINLILVTSTLLGMELSRGYLAKNLNRKKPTLTLAVITLLYTFADISILALVTFTDPLTYTKFIGETFLPVITENLLATYLALMSGPSASLAYRAPLQAFQWFSPILPHLPWGYKALIGVMTPTIGFIAINMATTQKDLRKAGIPTPRKPTLNRKNEKSMKGWLAISVFLVLTVWTTTGLFGFYPTIIASGSMTPTMEVGDVAIVVSTDTNKIQAGDIIQYQKEGEMTLHRVIEIHETPAGKIFITKGDANTAPDSDPVYPNQIKGKLILSIPKIGWISIAIKDFFAKAYTAITTLPQSLTNSATWATTSVYITTALSLTAGSYLLLSYKRKKKEEKT
jgi:signal peptidase